MYIAFLLIAGFVCLFVCLGHRLNAFLCLLQLSRINVRFQDFTQEDIQVRTDVEIVGAGDTFKWDNSDSPKASTEKLKAYKELEDDSVAVANEKSFLLGFNQFYRRSAYLNLESDVLNALSNASLVIRVTRVDDSPPPAAAPSTKKGAAPPPSQPAEESIFELWIPFSSLLTKKGSLFEFDGALDDSQVLGSMGVQLRSVKSNVMLPRSRIAWKLFADNDLAEYVIGSSIVRWQGAKLVAPPVAWSLHYNDVIDPKAKVKPTNADLRAKYLENIAKLIETQDKVCSYSVTIASSTSTSEDGEEQPPLLPTLTLSGGRIQFDAVAGGAVSVDEEIRNIPSLWTG
jgi:hypothetical protein